MNATEAIRPVKQANGLLGLFSVHDSDLNWRILRLLNLFRTVAAAILLLLYFEQTVQQFGAQHPELFVYASSAWLSLAIAFSFLLSARKPGISILAYSSLVSDIILVTLLTHASAGQTSGLGVLLFVSTVAGATLMRERIALAYAAIASLSLLSEQAFSHLEGAASENLYANAGITGIILFTTALVGSRVTQRFRESEELATRRGIDLENLSQVNEAVVQNMQTGILVIDGNNRVRQMNPSAGVLLNVDPRTGRQLQNVSSLLAGLVRHWREGEPSVVSSLKVGNRTLLLRMQQLGQPGPDASSGAAIIFLEDAAIAAEQIQQTKLAALGRLTASIAHEIRNPIGAISHANQLLAESELPGSDQRFVNIIRQQSARVNEIIENILQLGRRQDLQPEFLEITTWLRDFVMEYCDSHDLPLETIELESPIQDVLVRMDPGHLRQVLINLLDNARLHAEPDAEGRQAILRLTPTTSGSAGSLDIIDFGAGISAEVADQVFEPFYTSARSGTGLGLFIARELCECNHARLNYGRDGDGLSCFRITFTDQNFPLT